MEAKLREGDIQELLSNPDEWISKLEVYKERQLYDEAYRYNQRIQEVHYFNHEMKQLAKTLLVEKGIIDADQEWPIREETKYGNKLEAIKTNDAISYLKTIR